MADFLVASIIELSERTRLSGSFASNDDYFRIVSLFSGVWQQLKRFSFNNDEANGNALPFAQLTLFVLEWGQLLPLMLRHCLSSRSLFAVPVMIRCLCIATSAQASNLFASIVATSKSSSGDDETNVVVVCPIHLTISVSALCALLKAHWSAVKSEQDVESGAPVMLPFFDASLSLRHVRRSCETLLVEIASFLVPPHSQIGLRLIDAIRIAVPSSSTLLPSNSTIVVSAPFLQRMREAEKELLIAPMVRMIDETVMDALYAENWSSSMKYFGAKMPSHPIVFFFGFIFDLIRRHFFLKETCSCGVVCYCRYMLDDENHCRTRRYEAMTEIIGVALNDFLGKYAQFVPCIGEMSSARHFQWRSDVLHIVRWSRMLRLWLPTSATENDSRTWSEILRESLVRVLAVSSVLEHGDVLQQKPDAVPDDTAGVQDPKTTYVTSDFFHLVWNPSPISRTIDSDGSLGGMYDSECWMLPHLPVFGASRYVPQETILAAGIPHPLAPLAGFGGMSHTKHVTLMDVLANSL